MRSLKRTIKASYHLIQLFSVAELWSQMSFKKCSEELELDHLHQVVYSILKLLTKEKVFKMSCLQKGKTGHI